MTACSQRLRSSSSRRGEESAARASAPPRRPHGAPPGWEVGKRSRSAPKKLHLVRYLAAGTRSPAEGMSPGLTQRGRLRHVLRVLLADDTERAGRLFCAAKKLARRSLLKGKFLRDAPRHVAACAPAAALNICPIPPMCACIRASPLARRQPPGSALPLRTGS